MCGPGLDGARSCAVATRACGQPGGACGPPAYSTTIAGPTRGAPASSEVLAREAHGDDDRPHEQNALPRDTARRGSAGAGAAALRGARSRCALSRGPRGDDLDGVVLQPPPEAAPRGARGRPPRGPRRRPRRGRRTGRGSAARSSPRRRASRRRARSPRSPPRPAWRRPPRGPAVRSPAAGSGLSVERIGGGVSARAVPAADSTPAVAAPRRHAERAGEVDAAVRRRRRRRPAESRAGPGRPAWSSRRAPVAWTRSRSATTALGGAHARAAEALAEGLEGPLGRVLVEVSAPPENPRSDQRGGCAENHIGVGDRRDRAGGRRRPGRGPRRRSPVRRAGRGRRPLDATAAPPQPIVCMSRVGTAIAWPATRTSSPRAPSPRAASWNATSVLVPPMSSVAIGGVPRRRSSVGLADDPRGSGERDSHGLASGALGGEAAARAREDVLCRVPPSASPRRSR